MTVLFLLALVAVVWGFVRQAGIFMASHPAAPAPAAPASAPMGGSAAVLTLAPGAKIVSASTEAGKLVVQVTTPSGGEVEIIDLATGRLTGQVKTAPAK